MRVAINGFFQGQPNTGSGQYVISLTRTIADLSTHEIVVLRPVWPGEARIPADPSPGRTDPRPKPGAEALAGRQRAIDCSGQTTTYSVTVPFKGNIGKLWFEQIGVPMAARRLRADLLHVPYLGSPLLSPCPVVVTVHDLIMKILPEYRGSLAARSYTNMACAAAKRANLLIADSRCTRDDIIRLLRISPDKIRVIYLGFDERYLTRPDESALAAIRLKYGLGRKYIFYIGGLDSRKNVGGLIRAFGNIGGEWELAIAGRPHSKNQTIYPSLNDALSACAAAKQVKLLGFVPEDDKPALYSAAGLFVYPSLYEGFGLPPLEAMACGAPVICSNTSSLPEVVGMAALLADPNDGDAMVQCMRTILENEETAREMRRLARERAQLFSWRHAAVETLAAYDEVLNAAGQ